MNGARILMFRQIVNRILIWRANRWRIFADSSSSNFSFILYLLFTS
uniref:Uncharacterized protein n=1 Tax=Parascaris equorum TaxID=6256 RepID=A0A914R5W9_PAREQ